MADNRPAAAASSGSASQGNTCATVPCYELQDPTIQVDTKNLQEYTNLHECVLALVLQASKYH